MKLMLYNTLTKKKEIFKPIKKSQVRVYTCGPTVYWYQHIGNLRTYILSDVLKRVLRFNKFKIRQVMNVTDVGHLTGDADEGEDKVLEAAKREKITAWDVAKKYTEVFFEHSKKLNLVEPKIVCKATDHIEEQINLIKQLEEKGYNALDYRYFCLGTVYRKPLMFSWEALDGAKNARKKLMDKVKELKKSTSKENKVKHKKNLELFHKEINNDLNTPKVLAIVWEVLRDNNLSDKDKYSLLLKFDEILGLGLKDVKKERIPAEIKKLAEERLEARKNKDWTKSDQLRDKIKKLGYIIGDTKEGYEISKV